MKYILLILVFLMGCQRTAGIGSDTESDSAGDSATDTTAAPDSATNGPVDSDTTTPADSDTVADTSPDGDTVGDTDSGIATDSDSPMDSEPDTETVVDTETETDDPVTDCVDNFGWTCGCFGDCVDGTGFLMVYRKDNLPVDVGFWAPSEEEVDKALFWYSCAECNPCGERFSIKNGAGDWETVTNLEFCTAMVAYSEACGGCLTNGSDQ